MVYITFVSAFHVFTLIKVISSAFILCYVKIHDARNDLYKTINKCCSKICVSDV